MHFVPAPGGLLETHGELVVDLRRIDQARAAASVWAERLSFGVGTGWTIVTPPGPTPPGGKTTTGGLTVRADAAYSWKLSDSASVGIGAGIGAFGFGSAWHWVGILGGPTAQLAIKPWQPPVVRGLRLGLDVGRYPECTPWEHPLCPRFVGLVPAIGLSVTGVTESGVTVGASGAAQIFNNPIGLSAGAQLSLVVGLNLTRRR